MANVLAELFQNIAIEIRNKTGEQGKMKPAEFPDKIRAIEAGTAEPDLEEITIRENGVYEPAESDGYSKVTVNVQSGGTSGGNSEAELIPLSVTENGLYYPKENLETGKTYTLRNDYTQEELQALFEASLETSSDDMATYAFLHNGSEDMLGIMLAYGFYGVYISDGHLWLPAEFANEMGFDPGWNFGTDIMDLAPAGNPTRTFGETDIIYTESGISSLAPLFELKSYDGFNRVEVNVKSGGERNVIIKTGSYTVQSETEQKTIEHGLGVVPDMVIFRVVGTIPTTTKPASVLCGTFLAPWMVKEGQGTQYFSSIYNTSRAVTNAGGSYIDYTQQGGYNFIQGVTATHFTVGGISDRHQTGLTYYWTAFGNLI